eukprot:773632_1
MTNSIPHRKCEGRAIPRLFQSGRTCKTPAVDFSLCKFENRYIVCALVEDNMTTDASTKYNNIQKPDFISPCRFSNLMESKSGAKCPPKSVYANMWSSCLSPGIPLRLLSDDRNNPITLL